MSALSAVDVGHDGGSSYVEALVNAVGESRTMIASSIEVADLKTGQAGITGSWQRKVGEWLTPTHTTEIRPGARIPVPE